MTVKSFVSTSSVVLAAAALLVPSAAAQQSEYKIDSRDNIVKSARTLAANLRTYYKGTEKGETPGILPGPPTEHKGDYYWGQASAYWSAYLDHWHKTGDDRYNDIATQGLLHQAGEMYDYQPLNHTASLGNEDSCNWALAALLAAENGLPEPETEGVTWLGLAQKVFGNLAHPDRHDDTCGGGLRWQVPPTNMGYDYKNTMSNGCFFNLAAHLARFTGNETYAESAAATFDWLEKVKYVDTKEWRVFDGGHVQHNCTDINKAQFSFNAGILVEGAAFMYNFTNGGDEWKTRLDGLLKGIERDFFPEGIIKELPCEGRKGACTADMLAFKGTVLRWLGVTTQVAPYTSEVISPLLRSSAEAAVAQCTGKKDDGFEGAKCGFYWTDGEYVDTSRDKTTGAGEQMNVLQAVNALLINEAAAPMTSDEKDPSGTNDPSDTTDGTPASQSSAPPNSAATHVGSMNSGFAAAVAGTALFVAAVLL